MYLKNPIFNPNKSDNYYFFEFGSIPKYSRDKFRLKLMKRKGAESNKNLILFDSIEMLLKEDYLTYKDKNINRYLADKLKCSLRMLDCHKSRLLKQLRSFHFNWVEIQGESETDRILRKINTGMFREAKYDLINLQKKIESTKNKLQKKYLLFFVAEQLFYYYYYRNDLRKINHYYKKATNIRNSLRNQQGNCKITDDIHIRFTLLQIYKTTLNRFKLKNIQNAIHTLENLRLKYRGILNTEQLLKIHRLLGRYYHLLKFNNKSKSEFISALKLCEAENITAGKLVFKSFLFSRKFSENNKIVARAVNFHKNNFQKVIKYSTDVSQILDFQSNYLKFLIYSGEPDEEEITNNFINRQILYSRKSDALASWYLELSDVLSSCIFIWENKGSGLYIRVDNDILRKFEMLNQKSLTLLKNIYSPNILSVLYINLAEQEFWKANNADFLKADIYLKKLKRLIKNYRPNISNSWIDSTALGLNLFEYSRYNSHSRIISRFRMRLINLIHSISSRKQTFNIISDFAKLLFIKQQLGINEFNVIINDFENYLRKYYPGIIMNIKKIANSGSN